MIHLKIVQTSTPMWYISASWQWKLTSIRLNAVYFRYCRYLNTSQQMVKMKFAYVLFLTLALLITACGGSDSSMEMDSDAEMHEDGALMENDAMLEADSADVMIEADSADVMMETDSTMVEEEMEEHGGEAEEL